MTLKVLQNSAAQVSAITQFEQIEQCVDRYLVVTHVSAFSEEE